MALAFNGKGGGGSSPLLVATTTLTNAQILALPTTALQLVAAPGANKVIVPASCTLGPVGGPGTAYTNVDTSGNATWGLFYDTGGLYTLTNNYDNLPALLKLHPDGLFIGGMAWQVNGESDPSLGAVNQVNKPVYLWTNNNLAGNLTGGAAGNTLVASVLYSVATVA